MRIGAFLQNDSTFGKIMTKCGTIIALNVLFVISCIPFFTIGAAGTGMYYALFELLQLDSKEAGDDAINPFREYWKGVRKSFGKATICWITLAMIMIIGSINLQVCIQWNGWMKNMAAGVIAVMILTVVILSYLFPVMAVLDGNTKKLVKVSIYIAISQPVKMILIFILHVVPVSLLLLDEINRPTYIFIGAFFGAGMVAYLIARMLLPQLKNIRQSI